MTDSRSLRLEHAANGVRELRRAAHEAEQEFAAELGSVDPSMRESARNLVHYLAVRRHDVRDLQEELSRLGLSSLGRMEAHVMASLDEVTRVLQVLRGQEGGAEPAQAAVTFETGRALLARHADAILGMPAPGLGVRVMVTMPREAADQPGAIREQVEAGMGIMRINCAHDGPVEWERMVQHVHRAESETGKRCLVSFDLAGPKLRTGPVEPGPAVVKWRPKRDATGHVTAPARVRLVARMNGPEPGACVVPISAELVAAAAIGDTFELIDARGRERILAVVGRSAGECACEAVDTAYVVPETRIALRRGDEPVAEGAVGELPRRAGAIELRAGDTLDLLRGDSPGRGAERGDDGRMLAPATISCALGQLFEGVRAGEPILFDDGRIRGVIRAVHDDRLKIEITTVAGNRAKLRAEKGINVPQSELELAALTSKDISDLDFVATRADMVGLSFVQRPEDIEELISALDARDASRLGIVLKIETQAGFNRLPRILLAAMRHPTLPSWWRGETSAWRSDSSGCPRFRKRSSGCARPATCP